MGLEVGARVGGLFVGLAWATEFCVRDSYVLGWGRDRGLGTGNAMLSFSWVGLDGQVGRLGKVMAILSCFGFSI